MESNHHVRLMRPASCLWTTQALPAFAKASAGSSQPDIDGARPSKLRQKLQGRFRAKKGERRESNPYLLSHSQACKPLHHAHHEVHPARVARTSGGYRPPVLLLNYGCLERPAGSAPAISTLATWRLPGSTTAAGRKFNVLTC
jgi:hypothetical protein